MVKKRADLNVWVVTEGMAGTENQCLAVADALKAEPRVIQISLSQPWKSLTPALGGEIGATFSPRLEPPWPDLLITSGRKAVAAARYIKRQSKGETFCVHIQDPRGAHGIFDLIAVPSHDPARGDNVIVTDAAPNRLSERTLKNAHTRFAELGLRTGPRIAVLIGGASKAHRLPEPTMQRLINDLNALHAGHNATLMITASRRTGEENLTLLREAFLNKPAALLWTGSEDAEEGEENPYLGFLAHADYILVTSDSVSMLSDAAATGKPVYVYPLPGGGRRIDKFLEQLQEKGIARTFDGSLAQWRYEPLHEAERIAGEIRNRMGDAGE